MKLVKSGLITTLMVGCLLSGIANAQGQYYRYVNEEGVKVLGHSIPPKYVKNGYEIVSVTGRVIEVIEPAPDPKDVKAALERAELKEQYEALARRYSSVRDIEAAKQRKLVNVDASILLVDSNIGGIQEEIDDISSRAAEFERAGKAVPKNIMETLTALNEKMAATVATRNLRLEEKTIIEDRFTKELQLFNYGLESFEVNAKGQSSAGN